MKKIGIALSLVLLVTAAPPVSARRDVIPIFLRIEGYVGEKPKDPGSIMGTWTVDVGSNKPVDFYVTKLDVLTGNTSYMDIFSQLEPYTPSVTLNALPEEVQQFATAPPGKKVSMRAYLRRGASVRLLMVEYLDVET